MKRTVRTGPKRHRWRRRDWSGRHGIGQKRRDNNEQHVKREREAARAPKVPTDFALARWEAVLEQYGWPTDDF